MLGDRFFARVHAFDAACPKCGYLLRVGPAQGRKGLYDPQRARAKCNECKTVYIVGLMLWPVKLGGGGPGRHATRPADQLPGPRERLAYRQQAGGWWPREGLPRTRAEQSNATGPECTCPPPSSGILYADDCPLHGDDAPE